MMATTYASAKQFVGFAKEVTQGTPVAPTVTVPVEKFDPEDQVTQLDDTGLRGSMVDIYGRIAGVRKAEWSMSGAWFADTFGFLLGNILGDLTTTGAGAPYAHAFSTLNSASGQPGSLTITDYQGVPATYNARTYAGCCLSELSFKGNAESSLITFDAKGMGWQSAIAGAVPTSSPSTENPMAAWRFILGLAGPASGGTLVKTCSEFEVAIKRNLTPYYTGQNLDVPYVIHRGTLGVSGKLKFVADSEAPLTYMLNNTQPQFQLVFTNGVTPTSDPTYRAMTVDIAKAAFKTTKIDRGGTAVCYESEFDVPATTTNAGASGGYSPIKITLNNAVTSGTYV